MRERRAALLVLPARRVASLLGVERLFHVKHIFMVLASVAVVASRSGCCSIL